MDQTQAVSTTKSFPLALCGEGESVCISILSGTAALRERLSSLGLCRGATLEILHKMGGSIVVRRGESRLALDASMARKVMVSPA